MQLTEHFKLEEFINSRFYEEYQPKVWESYEKEKDVLLPTIQKLANQLEAIRNKIGKPLIINISYRPKWWEKKQGRSGTSQHCLGKASDLRVNGMTPKELHAVIEELISNGDILQGGLGLYNTFVHYDIRGTRARW